jgi:hypothetical protein
MEAGDLAFRGVERKACLILVPLLSLIPLHILKSNSANTFPTLGKQKPRTKPTPTPTAAPGRMFSRPKVESAKIIAKISRRTPASPPPS